MNQTDTFPDGGKHATLLALIRKDWRLARAPAVALLAIGIGCYLVPLSAYRGANLPATNSLERLEDSAVYAIFFPAIVAAALGAMAVAGERADRTADFMALLPVTRGQMILSKWLVTVFIICGSSAIQLAALLWMIHVDPRFRIRPWFLDGLELTSIWIAPVLTLFGVAWGLGTFTRNVSIAACTAIAAAVGVPMWFVIFGSHGRYYGLNWIMPAAEIEAVIGVTALAGGTVYYLRRVAP